MIKHTFKTMALGAALIFASCSNEGKNDNQADAQEQAEEVNDEKFEGDKENDAERMVKTYCGNIYEVRASEQAAMRANTVDVKKLAGMIVVAHNKMNTDIQALASRKNITLPADMTDEQRRDLEKLGERTGFDYDKEYAKQMKKTHEDAINDLEKTANRSEDAEIKQWASAAIPEVKSHLEMVEATIEAVKDLKEENRDKKKEKNTWEGKSDLHDGREDHHDDPKNN